MSLARCQSFISHIRNQNLLGTDDILRAIKQYGGLDRRVGQLASFYGYIKPEHIASTLQRQSTEEPHKRFGECAMELNFMTQDHIDRIIRIQNDDLFLFCQAVVLLKLSTMEQMIQHLNAFMKVRGVSVGPGIARGYKDESEQKETITRVKKLLKGINSIAPLPTTANKAMAMLNDPGVDITKLGNVIAVDPSFVGLLLKMVNSAFYGLRTRVSSVKNALVILGLNKLRQLILAVAVMQKFNQLPPAFSQKFWESSVWAGEWAKELGKNFRFEEADELFVAGLLHNVGELIVMQCFYPEQQKINELIAAGRPKLDAEREQLGGTHADIGSYLFGVWQLPPEVIQSTMYHHHDLPVVCATPNIKPHAYIVHLAAALAGIDPSLDDFTYQDELHKMFEKYRGLPFPGIAHINIDTIHERVAGSVANIMTIFAPQ